MPRRSNRHTVENSLSMSMYVLLRYARIRPGQDGGGQIFWTRQSSMHPPSSVAFLIATADPEAAHVRLMYTVDDAPMDYRIPLTRTPCPFGGWRWWFVCPISGRRTAKLYLPPGAVMFTCRSVHRLAYQSSRDSAGQRMHNLRRRLHRRLGAEYRGIASPVPERPKGMHTTTYARLIEAIEEAEWRMYEAWDAEPMPRILRDRLERAGG